MKGYTRVETKVRKRATGSSSFWETLYEALFILLKDEDSGLIKLALLRVIDFFQLMVFPLNSDVEFPWRAGSLYDSFESVIDAFQVINYLSNFAWTTYIVVFYLGILLVVLIILDLSLIHICRCRRYAVCRSRWSPYH
eukprot:TRINITY_DN13124_c0_g1_i1.p1 TRINITY_DN13124_c0_g1~~TRINITY_DN13124_c0_g1_i1.p1  ORF type:complete len:138 (-),score=38.21 TRINITY_DN13124_c0_g1_i1:16-429(-)